MTPFKRHTEGAVKKARGAHVVEAEVTIPGGEAADPERVGRPLAGACAQIGLREPERRQRAAAAVGAERSGSLDLEVQIRPGTR